MNLFKNNLENRDTDYILSACIYYNLFVIQRWTCWVDWARVFLEVLFFYSLLIYYHGTRAMWNEFTEFNILKHFMSLSIINTKWPLAKHIYCILKFYFQKKKNKENINISIINCFYVSASARYTFVYCIAALPLKWYVLNVNSR